MNIIKNFIRNRIADLIEWAIGAQLDKIRGSIGRNTNRFMTLRREQEKLRKTIDIVTDVGVDHNPLGRSEQSWAVVCTHGKRGRNLVKFYRLQDDNVETLRKLLKEFGAEGLIIDSHPQIIHDLYL